jgi:formylmethanofuran:tetrahydromethanopterin formyltransferase
MEVTSASLPIEISEGSFAVATIFGADTMLAPPSFASLSSASRAPIAASTDAASAFGEISAIVNDHSIVAEGSDSSSCASRLRMS